MSSKPPVSLGDAIRDALPEAVRDVEPVPPARMVELPEDRDERQAQARQHRHDRYRRRLPRRYASARLVDLDRHQDGGGRVQAWLDAGHQNLVLASTQPGLGKTHAAYAVGSEAVERGLIVEAYTVMELLAALRPNERDPEAPDRAMSGALSCDVLVLDDLGRERTTDWTQEQVHHVLTTRLGEGRRTVLTTNLTGPEMQDRYGAPLFDRVCDDAIIVQVTGTSRRAPVTW